MSSCRDGSKFASRTAHASWATSIGTACVLGQVMEHVARAGPARQAELSHPREVFLGVAEGDRRAAVTLEAAQGVQRQKRLMRRALIPVRIGAAW